MEIIISGSKYHQKTNEKSVHTKGKCTNDGFLWWSLPKECGNSNTYSNYLRSLGNIDDQISFEMNNKAKYTIFHMYIDILTRKNCTLFIKIEDFYTQEGREQLATSISEYLGGDGIIDREKMLNIINRVGTVKHNKTTDSFEMQYPTLFKKHHYQEFKSIFPADILEVFGYDT
jgi:hypothetical protein